MPSISESISLQKRRRKTLGKISPLIFLLLMHLIENTPNNFLPNKTRPATKIWTTKKVLGTIADKDKIAIMTLL